jgi:hypothetical protein
MNSELGGKGIAAQFVLWVVVCGMRKKLYLCEKLM